jgi:sugar lactone lactonase YvrE
MFVLRKLLLAFLLLASFASFSLLAQTVTAQTLPQLYISNEPGKSLQLLNLNNSVLTTIFNVGGTGELDDLTLNAAGQLIYSIPSLGEVDLYDPVAKTNKVLVSGLKWARDLEIEPGGQTMLIAIYSPGSIVRFNFASGTTTTLAKKLGTCDGITYDPYGNLYAVANHNTIVQINPTTGAIIKTLTLEPHAGVNGGDGLTYDSYTESLWATHDGTTGYKLLQIPVAAAGLPNSFSSFDLPAGITSPDGIKSDGKGNLYVGAIHTAFVYNIATNTVTQNITVKGADGVSLVPGTY